MSEPSDNSPYLPRFSVVCPVYNSKSYIEKTINSLLAQEVTPFELIVVDDGSADETPEFLRALFSRIQTPIEFVLVRNQHQGPGAARNAGIDRARGDWIAFLDSDDIWMPDKLAQVMSCLLQKPDANFICHHEELVRSNGTRQLLAYAQAYKAELPLPRQLYQMNLFSTSAVTCRRSLLMEKGRFDETLMTAQDYDLWLRLSPHIQVKFIELVLGQYVERPGNISSGSIRKRLVNELRIAIRHRHLTSVPDCARRMLRIFLSYGWLYLSKRLGALLRLK